MTTLVSSVALLMAFVADGVTVERWGVWEAELTGPSGPNLYTGVTCVATFSQGCKKLVVPGFWDGGNVFRLRFSPPALGEWTYVIRSNRPELDGKSGLLTAVAPTGNNHGPVEVFETFYLRYADGATYHPFGTTCYVWTHQTETLQEQTLKTLAAAPFNKIRFCVFPKSYTYNNNEPTAFAFRRNADGTFDFDQPDPAFWRQFERRILDLQRLGIEADLILWHPYDRWGFSEMTKAQDDRYLRYCIARLSAFRNVWWSLANEYDLMAPKAMKGHRGNKSMGDWDRFFQILANEDPHQRLRSIHNCSGFYDYTRPWVTHASIQTSDMHRGVEFRRQFNKPVIYDECKYEGNVPQGWGNLTAREMAERFWLGTLSGCYVGHGETYLHPEDVLWWSKGGTLHGASPARIQWLKAFISDAPPFHELEPLGDNRGRYLLAKSGAYYLLYASDGRQQPLDLAGDRPYKVDLVDPWAMTVTPLGTHLPGDAGFTPPRAGVAYLFIPYAPGEPLRPEAEITATPAAGRVPLDVRFTGPAGLKTRWEFGDGIASDEPSPVHRFTHPGLYPVTLTVTDPHGGSASAVREVLADRDPSMPLLLLGVTGGESHALKFGGSAKRSDAGGYLFTDAAPWGWAEAPPPEELRGLRAFTLTGWLRPESLTVGQGGNRILFCLNHNRDGIDLVHLHDGRMRLAVNQWPDGVSNDSSPGRLVPGRWTRFAVAYDGTAERDNVRWSFSAPLEAPDPAAPFAHDRTTSYAAGPVGGDIGPLAVGNFNATLRGAGLDRQFRGEIRGLTLFGSRADNAGAAPAFLDPVTSNSQASFRLPFDRTCPVFYDNDDHRDVYTDEYLMALAHLGEIRLVGITTTYAANAREYDLFVKGRAGIVEAAHRSGLRNIPDARPGSGARLKRPDSNRIEETQPLGLPASRALVEAARQASPDRPLVFLAGGQMTVAADALLLAPDIAPRLAVVGLFGAPGRDYNASLDAWAWTILLSKCRVFAVPFGTPQKRGTVFLKAAEVPKASIQGELSQNVPLFKWMLDKRHPNNPGPEEHDYDGQAAIALMRPEYISDIRRWRPDGIQPNGDVRLVRDDCGPVIEAVDADQRVATAEFWRALHALNTELLPPPAVTGSPILPPLRVAASRRFLETADGKPFFWLADTAWQLIHDLTREEADHYLANRAAKGFNVVQTVALAEHGGLNRPNAYGHLPLRGLDPERPDVREGDDYWKQVDYVIRRAAQRGIRVALLPTWGKHVTRDCFNGKVDGIFTVWNAETYGRFLGGRYREDSNVIWMLGGDRAAPTDEAKAIWRAMARGIAIGTSGREDYAKTLMTFHPVGPGDSADYFSDDAWLDFHGIQSGHGPVITNWKMIDRRYRHVPASPVIDLETTYAEIVFGRQVQPLTDDMSRRAAYWAVFAGACGHTYGHNSIWQMYAQGKASLAGAKIWWRDALDAPSAAQMGYMRRLFESVPFTTLKPDLSLLNFEQSVPQDMCLALCGKGMVLVYTPTGRTLDLNLDIFEAADVQASWFDPRNGISTPFGSFKGRGRRTFDPPGAEGSRNDWILHIQKQKP